MCPLPVLTFHDPSPLPPTSYPRIDGLKEHAEKMVTDAEFKAAQHRCDRCGACGAGCGLCVGWAWA